MGHARRMMISREMEMYSVYHQNGENHRDIMNLFPLIIRRIQVFELKVIRLIEEGDNVHFKKSPNGRTICLKIMRTSGIHY